jgi:hypothetical protein
VVDLSDAPEAIRKALRREAEVVLRVSGHCRHACQYKGATIKANKFCLVMQRCVAKAVVVAARCFPVLVTVLHSVL